jgi:filamentous hemagglutinin family protein
MRKKIAIIRLISLFSGVYFWLFAGISAYANPQGPQVIHGQAGFSNPNPQTLHVTNSPNAIINWKGFSIGSHEVTRFIQQSANSAVLNRVTGQDPSNLMGQLLSNGKVFLINPHGMVFGPNCVIDTAGFVASTLNITDQDFLQGNLKFEGNSDSGSIVNQGFITAGKNGDIYLIAPNIENSGIIHTEGGNLLLAAGESITITSLDLKDVHFEIQAPENEVLNIGKVLADGGAVNVFAGTLKHAGEIRADTVSVDETGAIILSASNDITLEAGSTVTANGAQGGTISVESEKGTTLVSGIVQATGLEGKGGEIRLLGERVGLIDTALIDASGESGGGEILIGGDYQGKNPDIRNASGTYVGSDVTITADAGILGDGGKVIVWSDDATRFYGSISARGGKQGGDGGFVEVSGKRSLQFSGTVATDAPRGETGTLLLDPTDVLISNFGGDITPAAITTALGANHVVIHTRSGGTDNGDITVGDPIDATTTLAYDTANSLTLLASRHVIFNASVQNAGSGDLNIVAGWDQSTEDPGGTAGTAVDPGGPFNIAAITGTPGSFGNDNGAGNGEVFINGASRSVSVGSSAGTTTVAASALTLHRGNVSTRWAQLGYHGAASGDIDVLLKGDLTADGGLWQSFAQVGHGGHNDDHNHSGSITIDTTIGGATGDIGFTGGTQAYAQLGHGGFNSDGVQSGDITVTAHDIIFSGGGPNGSQTIGYAYVQLGHGGHRATGNKNGDISVNANDLIFSGGSDLYGYAQLGHSGPFNGSGLLYTGKIAVTVNNLSLEGGTGGRAYAQVGHGAADGSEGPNIEGIIDIRVSVETSLSGGAWPNYWMIGHRNYSTASITNAPVLFLSNGLDYTIGDAVDTGSFDINADFAGRFQEDLRGGEVTIGSTGTGTLDIDQTFNADTSNALHFLSRSDLDVSATVDDAGNDSTTAFISGWDGSTGITATGTLNVADILSTPSSYGQNDGDMSIGAAIGGTAAFQSINLAGDDIDLGATLAAAGGTMNIAMGGVLSGSGPLRILSGGTFSIDTSMIIPTDIEVNDSILNVGANTMFNGDLTLTGAGGLIQGNGIIYLNGDFFFNRGTIASGVGAFETYGNTFIGSTGDALIDNRTWNNHGTVEWVGNNFSLNKAFNNVAGEIFRIQTAGTLGGSGIINNWGYFEKLSGGLTTVDVTFNNFGTVNVNSGVMELNGSGTHGGSFNVASPANLEFAGGTHVFNGLSNFNGSGFYVLSGGSFAGAGTVTNNAIFDIMTGTSIAPAFINAGTTSGSGTVNFQGGYTQTAGHTFVMSGANLEVTGPLTLNGGILMGDGTITGDVENNGGVINAGLSPGTLTITGNYVQGPGGVLMVELGGLSQGVTYDLLDISGTATLDGMLYVTYYDTFSPIEGDQFDIITCSTGGMIDDFATVDVPVGYSFLNAPFLGPPNDFYQLEFAGITAGGDGTLPGVPSMADPVPDVVTLNEQFQGDVSQGGIVPEQGEVKEEEDEKKRGRLICR